MSKNKEKEILDNENEELEEEQTLNEEIEQEDAALIEIEQLHMRIEELEDQYLRANAEFDNIKRRMEKEKRQSIIYAHEQFARDLLSVIDSLESGIDSLNEQEDADSEMINKMKEGIDLTIDQFKKVFEKNGIKLIEMEAGFNPHFHEAVMKIDSEEHNEGDIVQVFQKGYLIKDRVLRPAMVSIAK